MEDADIKLVKQKNCTTSAKLKSLKMIILDKFLTNGAVIDCDHTMIQYMKMYIAVHNPMYNEL